MKRIAGTVMVLSVFAMFCAAGLYAQEHKGPKIKLKEERHDFGQVTQGAQPLHVFEIQNAGDELLEIQKVQPS